MQYIKMEKIMELVVWKNHGIIFIDLCNGGKKTEVYRHRDPVYIRHKLDILKEILGCKALLDRVDV